MSQLLHQLFRLVDGLLPASEKNGSEENLRNARIVYSALLLIIVNDLIFGLLGLVQHDRILPWIVLSSGFLSCVAPLIHRFSGSLRLAATWISTIGTLMLASTMALSGGLHSTSQAWFGALVVFIIVSQGTRVALFWTGAIALETLSIWFLARHGYALPDFENPADKAVSWAISFPAGLFLIVCLLHGFFEAHRRAIRNLDRQAQALLIQAQELGQAKSEAEAASKSRSEFIATVSHEIRTPMNGILGVAQLMNGTDLSPDQQKFMDALKMSAEGLLSILGDILDFSKIEAGKLEVQSESFELKSMCRESYSVFAGIAEARKLDIKLDFHAGLPEQVMGDPVRIRQILLNLIGNSVKFTERGSISLEIAPCPGRREWIRFSVKDTGIGMSEKTKKILFQPYTQADASSSRKYGGTGLGLAICNRLVVLMGGAITVDTSLGAGSTFTVDLPLPIDLAIKAKPIPPAKPERSPAPPNVPLQRIHVLLAEDNAVNSMVAVKMLEKLNVDVEVAKNGLEAVDRWQTQTFDLIFMDCQMPGMDGYEASRTIRAQEKASHGNQRIPIVALTAHAMEEDRLHCLDAGMDAYLTKPVKSEFLQKALDTWVKVRSSPREK